MSALSMLGMSFVLALLSWTAGKVQHSVVVMACILAAWAIGYIYAMFSFISMIRGE